VNVDLVFDTAQVVALEWVPQIYQEFESDSSRQWIDDHGFRYSVFFTLGFRPDDHLVDVDEAN
jgi:hypothetical protein